jgi:hypothetical protein
VKLHSSLQAAILGVLAILGGALIAAWFAFLPLALHGRADFRQLYVAGAMVRAGHGGEIYDYETEKKFQDQLVHPEETALPFNHLAYESLLLVPFSMLRYKAAYFAFLALNVAFLALAIAALRPYFAGLANFSRPLPVLLAVCFVPVEVALMQGQDSILLLALCSLAYVCLRTEKPLRAGLLLGFGLFKFQIVLPIALLFLVWKRWRFVAGFCASSAVCALISLWLVGAGQMRAYARSLISMSAGLTSDVQRSIYGISPAQMPNLRGLIYGLAYGKIPSFWLQTITLSLSCLLLLVVAMRPPRVQSGALPIAITAGAMVSYHMLIHDAAVLLLPIGLTLDDFLAQEITGAAENIPIAALAALVYIATICPAPFPQHVYLVAFIILAYLLASLRRA